MERRADEFPTEARHTDSADEQRSREELVVEEVDAGDRRETASSQALFPERETADFNSRWQSLQARFVDEPRRTVEEADGLVREVVARLTESFGSERERLEGQWRSGEEVSTEDLRVALQRYRSFFERLLTT